MAQPTLGKVRRPLSKALYLSISEIQFYSFDSLKAATNIIFSNGLLDPWHTSGVLQSISSSLIAVVIPGMFSHHLVILNLIHAESAHHFDLRGPRAGDPIYVTQARMREDSIIGGWIRDYFNKH